MFESIVLRNSKDAGNITLGAIAEALLFYQNSRIVVGHGTLVGGIDGSTGRIIPPGHADRHGTLAIGRTAYLYIDPVSHVTCGRGKGIIIQARVIRIEISIAYGDRIKAPAISQTAGHWEITTGQAVVS